MRTLIETLAHIVDQKEYGILLNKAHPSRSQDIELTLFKELKPKSGKRGLFVHIKVYFNVADLLTESVIDEVRNGLGKIDEVFLTLQGQLDGSVAP